MNNLKVYGRYGCLTVCPITGNVLALCAFGNDDTYEDIARFDITEYRLWAMWNLPPRHPALESITLPMIGRWKWNGQYVAPDLDHRPLIY